ncbi:MAG: hypothetical protein LC808_39000 [Actinobacteria bacterium]|nr:hypothetical protein [Actinomycetota bacterium]
MSTIWDRAFEQVARGSRVVAFAGYHFVFYFPGQAIVLNYPEFQPALTQGEYLRRLASEDGILPYSEGRSTRYRS